MDGVDLVDLVDLVDTVDTVDPVGLGGNAGLGKCGWRNDCQLPTRARGAHYALLTQFVVFAFFDLSHDDIADIVFLRCFAFI